VAKAGTNIDAIAAIIVWQVIRDLEEFGSLIAWSRHRV
jgi:hypothetical protein